MLALASIATPSSRAFAQDAAATEAGRPGWLEGSVTLPFEIVGLIVGLAIACGLVYFASKWLRPTTQTQADRERKSRAMLQPESQEGSPRKESSQETP